MHKMEKISACNNSLLGEVDQLTSQLKTEQARNLQLEEKLLACEAMQKTLSELEQRLVDIQQENEILKTANDQLLNSIEVSDTDDNQQLEEPRALRLQVAQLEAIIKSDNDEKAALEKELAERVDLYQRLQEEHVNLEKAHADVTTRLETTKKDLQNLQEEAHKGSLSVNKIIQPDSLANAGGGMLTNGFSPSAPGGSKKFLDKEVQVTLLENSCQEMTKLKEEQQFIIGEERLRIKELQSLLKEKSKKIETLEKHLTLVPSKQVQVTEVCAPNEADDEHCLSLVRRGQSFLEIHLNKIIFTSRQEASDRNTYPPVFATWTFADFQPQSTPVATGDCPEFNCTARYAVAVDSDFLDYLDKGSVDIQVQSVHGAKVQSMGTCQIALRPAVQEPFKRSCSQAAIIGIQDGHRKHFVGTLSCWVRFLPAPDPAKQFLNFSVPGSPPKKLPNSVAEQQSGRQNGEPASAMYNQLNVNIVRCVGIPLKQGQMRKGVYCCYQLGGFPVQETGLATTVVNCADFHYANTFSVRMDSQLHKQLLSQSFVLLVFDEEDAEPGSFVGRASVPLSPLALGRALRGPFPLANPWGEDAGSVDVKITWGQEYTPPEKPVPRARSKDAVGIHQTKRLPSARHQPSMLNFSPNTSGQLKDSQVLQRPRRSSKNERKKILSSRKGKRESDERTESSSLTSVSSLSSACAANGTRGMEDNENQKQEVGNSATGVNSSLIEESQSIEEFSNGQVVVVKTPALKRSGTFKVSDVAVFSVNNLGFLPGAVVLRDKSVEMVFVEFQFLNCSPEELETPVALPKPKPPERIAFNFRKVVHLDAIRHRERREVLASMLSSKDTNSAIIKFTVVSEPMGKDKDAECQDIGFAIIDLKQIVKYGKDIIEEDVDVLDTRSNKAIGKLNVSVEMLAALKHILAESKHACRVPL